MQSIAARYRGRAAKKARTKRTRAYYARAAGRSSRAKRSAVRTLANQRTGGFLGIEYKFLDCAWNGVTIATTTDGSGIELNPSSGCTLAISVPAQGNGQSERDGRKYCIKSVWFSGVINTAPVSDSADVIDRQGYFFALVLDTQTNGGTATGIDSEAVYINPSSGAGAMMPQPLRNLANSKRFRILASTYVPPGGAYAANDNAGTAAFTSSVNSQTRPKVSLSWRGNLVADSLGTTANVTSAADYSIHVVACAGETAFTPTFEGKSRVRFVG